MIAAITSSKLLFNWFDVALVLVFGFGFWRGRKHGMTKEFVPFCRWLFIVVLAGFGYRLLGDQFIQWGVVKKIFGQSINEKTGAYIMSYLIITCAVVLAFIYLNRFLKPKLDGSNVFGSSEYYFGVVAGMFRYACISLFALALLHAPYYTSAEISAQAAYNNRWYGGGMKDFKGDYIPTVYEAQAAVFTDSLFGPFIAKGMSEVLIDTRPPVQENTAVVDIRQ